MKPARLSLFLLAALLFGSLPPGWARANPPPMTRDQIIARSKTVVGYSYWWGHGAWSLSGQSHGSCAGSCPNCSHSGGYGADCSGFVGKAWEVDKEVPLTTDYHPYSTVSFQYASTWWKPVSRGAMKPGDAFVFNQGGEGHIFIYAGGDPWGNVNAYECKGCSYGCVSDNRPAYSVYVGRVRDNLVDAIDTDGDGIPDTKDNCDKVVNKDQSDIDKDGIGDACDPDIDNEGVLNAKDNCPKVVNKDQADLDKDGIGDACDPDLDNDGVLNAKDNCPKVANKSQADIDKDGIGDACDPDIDGDGIANAKDNCPYVANADQLDTNKDGKGDACQLDDDADGIPDAKDNCPKVANADQADTDKDGLGDACDPDIDNDGILNAKDNCPEAANPDQADLDRDQIGDVCDPDLDGDGIANGDDNCPAVANPDQDDLDGDGKGDVCDEDVDGDGVLNATDNCPTVANPDQADANKDGVGDACGGDGDDRADGGTLPDGGSALSLSAGGCGVGGGGRHDPGSAAAGLCALIALFGRFVIRRPR